MRCFFISLRGNAEFWLVKPIWNQGANIALHLSTIAENVEAFIVKKGDSARCRPGRHRRQRGVRIISCQNGLTPFMIDYAILELHHSVSKKLNYSQPEPNVNGFFRKGSLQFLPSWYRRTAWLCSRRVLEKWWVPLFLETK